jgi:hypothetical protein
MRTSLWLVCSFLFAAACGVSSPDGAAGSRAAISDESSASSELSGVESTGLDPSLAVMLAGDSAIVPADFPSCHGWVVFNVPKSCGPWSSPVTCGGRVCTGNICGAQCPKTEPDCIMSSSVQQTESFRTCTFADNSQANEWQPLGGSNPRCNCVN